MTTIQITLPDQLAREARHAGLLKSGRIEKFLREQLHAQSINELFDAMDSMAMVDDPAAMSPEEMAHELATSCNHGQRANY